ncbi:MAG: hypothetical protein Q8O00_03120, partial [Holophaga sp.]|nr:hypothetical protein [Holophaga sp.]
TFRYTTVVTRFWDQPGVGTQTVPLSAVINPANYGYVYDYQVPNAVFAIDKKFKPDVSKETTLGYRRSYSNGGSLVATLVHRTWADLPISLGNPATINVADPTGSGLPSKTNYLRTLTNDANGKRQYNAIELEFKTPIIPGTLYLNGAYTYGRTTGNNQMQDATTFQSAGIEAGTFDPYLLAAGVPEDAFNPMGQLGTSQNNVMRLMLLYNVKVGGVKTTISLLGRYNDGSVENRATNGVVNPTGTFPVGSPIQLPSAYTRYWNGARGQYSQADFTSFDFAYNLEIPLKRKAVLFSTLAITNVFNTIRPAIYYWANGGTQATPLGYRINHSFANIYGGVSSSGSFNGGRDFNLDIGLRF